MKGQDLCKVLREELSVKNNSELAEALGVTPAAISVVQSSSKNLTTRRVAKFVKRAINHKLGNQFSNAVHPIVEFFDVDRCPSKKGAVWLPFDPKVHSGLHADLKNAKGLYAFYNSEGEIIYFGKTVKRNLFDEMVSAFNRSMSSYSLLKVSHPWKKYKPNEDTIRQIKKSSVHIFDTARYFSCYKVENDLIASLEALIIRVIPNDLINVKMEKLTKSVKKSGNTANG